MNGPHKSVQIVGLVLLLGVLIALVAIAVRIRPSQPQEIVVQPAAVPKIVVEAPELPPAATPQIVIIGSETPFVLSTAQTEELQSLRQQHVEALRELVEIKSIRYEQGSDSINVVLNAHRELVTAELAAASRPMDRIIVLEKYLKALSVSEEIQRARAEVGTGRTDDYAEAKAAVAEARIDLYLERLKQMSAGLDTAPATTAPETSLEEAF